MASRTVSGDSGGARSEGKPRWPRSDSAAPRNHASNSRLATTTLRGRSHRASSAPSKIRGPSCAGQSSSASSKINKAPPGAVLRAIISTARASSSCFSILPLGRRNGRGISTSTMPCRASSRLIRMGNASTSPWPSTMMPILMDSRRTGRAAFPWKCACSRARAGSGAKARLL